MAYRQSGFKLYFESSFFPVCFFFSFFFNLLVCFPFIPTAGALFELHEDCDKRISELLGMIRCNKNNYDINTNEIQGELSRKNLIPSHVKIINRTWPLGDT